MRIIKIKTPSCYNLLLYKGWVLFSNSMCERFSNCFWIKSLKEIESFKVILTFELGEREGGRERERERERDLVLKFSTYLWFSVLFMFRWILRTLSELRIDFTPGVKYVF